MATGLNQAICGVNETGNTGVPNCFQDISLIRKVILAPKGFKITKAQIASTLAATLKAATLAARGSRIYPINLEYLEADNSEAPTKAKLPNGKEVFIKENPYNWTFGYTEGGLCLSNQLQQFNGDVYGFLVDKNGLLIGKKSGNDLESFPLNFYAANWKLATESEPAKYFITLQFDTKYVNQYIGFVNTSDKGFDIFDDVEGLLNVILEEYTVFDLVTGKVSVQVKTSCGGENLFSLYSTGLATVPAWVIKKESTGGVITVSTVVANSATEAFDITMDTADPDFPTVILTPITINLTTPAILAATPINMSGYENIVSLIVND